LDRYYPECTITCSTPVRTANRKPTRGPDDPEIKFPRLREISNGEKPLYLNVAVSTGTGVWVSYGDNGSRSETEIQQPCTCARSKDTGHERFDPAGIISQEPALSAWLHPVLAGQWLANFLTVPTLVAHVIARAFGKICTRNLEPGDMVLITVEAAAMARISAAGTDWFPGL
jgi:hypothetical protein